MSTTQRKLREDFEDLARTRRDPEECSEDKPWWKRLGPGLLTGAADDDPSGVGTYSATGAQFGYLLLWLVPFCIPLMVAVQEMCARQALVTGSGLASVIKEHYPKWLLYSCTGLLFVANAFNVYADLQVMASSLQMLTGIGTGLALILLVGVLVLTQIFVPYRAYARALKWLCISLAGYVVVAFIPGVRNDWGAIARAAFIPSLNLTPVVMLGLVAVLGTTISPYLFFWQAGETVEEQVADRAADEPGRRLEPVRESHIRNIRADTATGMIVSQLVAAFIMIAAAGTLHATGQTHIDTAQDAAKALLPLGRAAYWIFSLCILGTGLLAIPTLAGSAAYAAAETFGWRYGLYRRFARARGFYLTAAAVIIFGGAFNFVHILSPIAALVYSAALNGIIAPPLIVVLILICNNRRIMGKRTNGPWSNTFSGLTVILMGAAAVYLVWAKASGRG